MGILTAATLAISAESASAGTTEKNAITANLQRLFGPDASLANATPAQLASAVKAVLDSSPKLNPGIVAGEALKSPAATVLNAGDEIAQSVLNFLNSTGPAPLTTLQRVLADAAKTAGRGTGADASEVVGFSDVFPLTESGAINAALQALSTKTGASSILAGYARGLASDAARAAFVKAVLANKKFNSSASQIGTSIGDVATDTDTLIKQLITDTPKLALNLISGVVASDPQNAGAITEQALLTAKTATGLTTFSKSKGVSLAKAVGKTADIEQISLVGNFIANEIGEGRMPLSQAASLTKTLAKAIFTKPLGHTGINKADEIGEVAAAVMAQAITPGAVGSLASNNPGSIALAIINAAVAGGKGKSPLALPTGYIADVAGSVALTIELSNLPQSVKDAIEAYLLKPSNIKKISKNFAGAVETALKEGFTGNAAAQAKYENGNNVGSLFDPETPVLNG